MLIQPVAQLDITSPRINNDMAKSVLWAFFRSNPDRVILKVAFIKVRIKDLRVLFEALAGPEPR